MTNKPASNDKAVITPSGDCQTRFPVIELSRSDLELFFPKELVLRLSDDDMAAIADRYGDAIGDYADELRGIAARFMERLQ